MAHVVRWLQAARLLALALPLAATALAALLTYRHALEAAITRADRSARIAEEHALRLFDTNQMLLLRMLDLVGRRADAELRLPQQTAELSATLARMAAELPQVQGLFINGADARPIANSRVYPVPTGLDFSDREWYRVHRSGQGPALFVSELLTSKLTGEAFFDMSRRRTDEQGRFAGTVHVSLRPEFLMQFYAQLGESEPGLRLTVYREDGRLLAAWPRTRGLTVIPPGHPMRAELDAHAKHGQLDGASPLDGTPRLGAFRRLDPYPLYAMASIDRATVVAAWARRTALIGAVLMAIGALAAWLAHVALGRVRRDLRAARLLHEESERRARAEASLVQAQRLETLGRLVGGVTHDFNNVLAVISSHALLLRRAGAGAGADVGAGAGAGDMRERSLDAIERAVGTGTRLAQQLLTVSRRRAARLEVVDLHDRLPAIGELLRPVFGPSVAVQVLVARGTRSIEVDVGELEVALINLAINARDAMPEGGRFELRARNATAADDEAYASGFVVIEAIDSGRGMDEETAAQAFEPFFTTKAAGKGTGLGLSQVQAMCAACHGSARIRSRPGMGAQVQLFLAAAQMPAQAQACVLFVRPAGLDDDLLQSGLRAAGCDVLAVDDARMARALLAGRNPHVDFALLDADGHGARAADAWIRRLHRVRPGLPVLAATSAAGGDERPLEGADLVLRKPCPAHVLQSALVFARRAGAAQAVAG